MTEISEPTPAYLHNVRFRKGWLAREARVCVVASGLAGRDAKLPPPVAPKAIVAAQQSPPSTTQMVTWSRTVWLQLSAIGCAVVAKVKAVTLGVGTAATWFVEELPDLNRNVNGHVSAVRDAAQLAGPPSGERRGAAAGAGVRGVGDRRDRKKLKTLEATAS